MATLKFMIVYLISSLLLALAGGIVYVYYFYQGQFDEPEGEVKYQMFRDQDQ